MGDINTPKGGDLTMAMPKNITVDEALSKVMGLKVGTKISGLEITKYVWKYIKSHKLQGKAK